MRSRLLTSLAAAALIATPALAQDEHVVKFPGKSLFDSGLLRINFIGPEVGSNITGTSYDITWHNTGANDPRDLSIELGVPVGSEVVWHTITGADLGFTSDATVQSGTYATKLFNGVVYQNYFFGSTVEAFIWDEVEGNVDGFFVNSTVTFTLGAASCLADVNGDGVLDNSDILAFVQAYVSGDGAADFNADGIIDNGDVFAFIHAYLFDCG